MQIESTKIYKWETNKNSGKNENKPRKHKLTRRNDKTKLRNCEFHVFWYFLRFCALPHFFFHFLLLRKMKKKFLFDKLLTHIWVNDATWTFIPFFFILRAGIVREYVAINRIRFVVMDLFRECFIILFSFFLSFPFVVYLSVINLWQ